MSTDRHDDQAWAAWHAERERDLAAPHGWLGDVLPFAVTAGEKTPVRSP